MNIQTTIVPGAPWPLRINSLNRQPEKLTSGQKYAKKSKVLDYLKTQDDFVSVAHIADALSMTYTRTQDALKRLRRRGLLVCTKKPAVKRCGHVGIVGFYMASEQEDIEV